MPHVIAWLGLSALSHKMPELYARDVRMEMEPPKTAPDSPTKSVVTSHRPANKGRNQQVVSMLATRKSWRMVYFCEMAAQVQHCTHE